MDDIALFVIMRYATLTPNPLSQRERGFEAVLCIYENCYRASIHIKRLFRKGKPFVMLLAAIALSRPAIAESAPPNACPIAQSIYRDGDGKGFQLVFGPPPPGKPYLATAAIDHPQQKPLYRFLVTQSSGYGSIWLIDRAEDSPNRHSFGIAFFDRQLKSATPLFFGEETESPHYAAIAALGSHDHYQRRGSITPETPPLLADVIWIFHRCQ